MTEITEYPLYQFPAQKEGHPIHTLMVDSDGIVEHQEAETYYEICEKIVDYGDFLGFISDDGASGFNETRVPKAVLVEILKDFKP